MIRPQIILPLLAALAALGPVARTQSSDFPAAPPPDAPPSKVKPAPLLRETLPNGLRVVIQENHRVPAVQIQMGIRAGLVSDPVDVPYMAVLAEHMVEAGSEKYNPEKREKAANGMGGELGIGLREDYVEVSASCLSVHFNKMLGLMADMVLNPKLDRDYMDAFTEGITEAVKRRRVPPPPDESKGRQAYAVRYPTAETVKKLDRDHVFEYLENYYAPNNSILVICGDVDAETAMTQVKSALGSWRPGVTPPLPHFVKEEIRPFYYLFCRMNRTPSNRSFKCRLAYRVWMNRIGSPCSWRMSSWANRWIRACSALYAKNTVTCTASAAAFGSISTPRSFVSQQSAAPP